MIDERETNDQLLAECRRRGLLPRDRYGGSALVNPYSDLPDWIWECDRVEVFAGAGNDPLGWNARARVQQIEKLRHRVWAWLLSAGTKLDTGDRP